MKKLSEQELQIKTKKRVKDHGEVFTAEREVKAMCDLIPKEVWSNIDSTFLEPSCGTGNFIVEILRRKFALCMTPEDGIRAIRSVWGIELLMDNAVECRARIFKLYAKTFPSANADDLTEAIAIARMHIICGDALEIMKSWEE